MIRKVLFTGTLMMAVFSGMAQKKQGREAISNLCGCFAVTFNYAETFTNDTTVKRLAHPMDNFAVTELAYIIEETKDKVMIQHLLVIPDGKGTVIKHWREDWQYEQTERWQYTNDKEWTRLQLPRAAVKGQWTQSVWEVSDAPRYAGSSEWVRANNQIFWLNTTDAPLPRREYTTRKDYNILERTNRITVSPAGYLHEQDNKKIIRNPGTADSLLAGEKGYNKYVRLPDSACAGAKAFWTAERAAYWQDVKEVWAQKMNASGKIILQNKVAGKVLFMELDELAEKELAREEKKKAVEALISKYL
ncbi:MAG: hypothetical protein P0Y53_24040 [Candidatus Pseudobacter hemicellulosilyticus]|uniref:Uncharacterized protein n=1 Tax=Candidatus Pseudobacter hemicellulosilyticus TaxID=3121375 RepID=A0AAJ5WTU9_9BACT|nr:MAG: hypothetical protein P0Y53_24040 [Pseudobacter sp.]